MTAQGTGQESGQESAQGTGRADGARRAPVRVAVAGAHGFGRRHLDGLEVLQAEGLVRVVGVADPVPPGPGEVGDDVAVFGALHELLAHVPVDVVVVATPIHTHAPLATAALRAGADVLLEKPPVSSLADFEALLGVVAETGRRCQVGFQSLGGGGVEALARLVREGALGDDVRIGALGTWVRPLSYWQRSRWAGRRRLDGVDVVDGAVTNPLAHAVATALRVAGARSTADVTAVETDLFRVNDVECDDTSVVRAATASGLPVTIAVTLCARRQTDPVVTARGSRGSAVLHYTTDVLDVALDGRAPTSTRYERTNLVRDLLQRRQDGGALLSDLADSGAFTRILDAVRTAPDPRPVDPGLVVWAGRGSERHPVLRDVEHWVHRAVAESRTFTALGAPWTGAPAQPRPRPAVLRRFAAGGREVAACVDGSEVVPSSSPRPYLHPVRTPAGTALTDAHPADHDWHLGVGVALQDVAVAGTGRGWNFWGGRTYVRGQGYTWRDDHGHQVHLGWRAEGDGEAVEDLAWRTADGEDVLHEERTWRWGAGTLREDGRAVEFSRLDCAFRLAPAGEADVELGSPGSNGREGGGYGGFTWRLPRCRDVEVRTPAAAGEEAVHGTTAPWLAWSAEFGPRGAAATLVLVPLTPASAADPWFVRVAGYPGVGSALAWDEPVRARPGAPVERAFRALLADGRLDDALVERLVRTAGSSPGPV